jgi:hypothetical protein
MDNEFQQILDQIGTAKTGEKSLDQAMKHWTERKQRKDRSFIVVCVVGLYVFSIVVAILYLIGRALWCGEDHFRDVSELIKVAVIPVLTLVIGYYFGTSRS